MKTNSGTQVLSKQTLESAGTGSRVTLVTFCTQKESKEANQTNEATASKVGENFSYCI